MTEVISVRFKDKGKVYFFDPSGLEVKTGDRIVVETTKGLEFAECTYGNHMVEDTAVYPPLRPVVRVATEADIKKAADNRAREAEAFRICQEKIVQHGMDMKLVDVEYNFEGSKILFFFTSDGRVDFRELVKDLASVFKTRIELRQIGVRDEARMLGGLGICGKPFCCSQFLDEFHPVSIKMAKTQGLSLNPTKISGTCGRLMCCLKYEQVAYEDLVKKAPKMDAFVDTPAGKGSVTGINLLKGVAKVRLEDTNELTFKTFVFDDLEVLGGKARRAEYIAARDSGTLEEAGFKPSNIRPAKSVEKRAEKQPEPPFPPILGMEEQTSSPDSAESASAPKKNRRRRKSGKGRSSGQQQKSQTAGGDKQDAADKKQHQKQRPPKQQGKQQKQQPSSQTDKPKDAGEEHHSRQQGRPRRRRRGGKKPGGSTPASSENS